MFSLRCLLLVLFFIGRMTTSPAEDAWDFAPADDDFRAGALLDLRSLNEKQSGEHGFIKLSKDKNSFTRGDEAPIRFWAIGSGIYQKSPEEMDLHCKFLAKRGVNMVRLHATIAATEEGAKITDVNEKEIEGIFRFVKAAKEVGIYLTISPYYGMHGTPKSWELEGYAGKNPWGALFVDPRMQEGYKAWTRALYTRVNPHTGLAIKDDATVAILQVHNEDSMFFWTFAALPAPQAKRLSTEFGKWLVKKYGDAKATQAAWEGDKQDGDEWSAPAPVILGSWHLTQDFPGGLGKRVRDQTEFMARWQRDFYASMGEYLRKELGCKQLLNATNWRTANDLKLKEIERWTYAALDIGAENEYYGSDYQHIGENNGYRIDPDHFLVNESALKKPLELTTNFKQEAGMPFIVTETSWKNPNLYQTEGPFLTAAYQSLGGVDAVFWFTATDPTWCLDPRFTFWHVREMNPINKWTVSIPAFIGAFPANAVVFRERLLKEGRPVVVEERTLEDLFDRKPPQIDDGEIYGVNEAGDELSRAARSDGRISRAAFLVGPVVARTDAKETKPHPAKDFSKSLNADKKTIRASTDEISFDYGRGLCTVDAPAAQGIAGFLKQAGGEFKLSNLQVESKNEYAVIQTVSLDSKPLAESEKILIQVATTCKLTGWKTKPADFEFDKKTIHGEQIVDTGKPPWRVASTQASITLKKCRVEHATLLDANGCSVEELKVTRKGQSLQVELPENAMYVILH